MSKQTERAGKRSFELSEEEAASVRRLVLHMARPYLAVAVVLAVVVIASPHLVGVKPAPESRLPTAAQPVGPAEPVYARAEVQRVVSELIDLSAKPAEPQKDPRLDKALKRIDSVAASIAKSESRLRELEQRAESAPAAANSLGGTTTNLEQRLGVVEARQRVGTDELGQRLDTLLDRLELLEARLDRLEP
jgi:hypothetical protein